MSYDISLHLQIDTGGPELVDYCADDIGNYTANVSGMWQEALGRRLADYHGMTAADAQADLVRAVRDMTTDAAKYEAMNPPNGWGDYEGALDYLTRLRNACLAHPKARIRISH
ncbi:hypothetical protein [Streptomyces sp. NBC_01353]|uniref:hypothetical protein n=1 Tax=Streptomyces sp. NBC_01353 TaxID=2903835 RepID=UPI002E32DF08|nr:hypothetical protein [Streptomyces sp. NBC_01353]